MRLLSADMGAEAGLGPATFDLWGRRATNCSTPRYIKARFVIFVAKKNKCISSDCS